MTERLAAAADRARSGPPPIDAELLGFLPAAPADRPFVDGADGIARLRAAMAEYEQSVEEVRELTGAQLREVTIGGVPAIVIRPPSESAGRGAVLNVHGGGLVAGSHRSALADNAQLALDLDCVMVVLDYRLAPEHPYPAALDDVATVWGWLADGGLDDVVDRRRLVLMGGSAGGCLAAGLTVRLLAAGRAVPSALVLIQPQLDDRNLLPSTYELDQAHFWDRPSNLLSWSVYLGGRTEVPPDAAPARAEDLSGFPRTFLEIGQVDLFRDEEIEFGARLSRCGVPVEMHVWAGAFHGFDGLRATRVAQRALAVRADFLRQVLSDR